jgi:hypothetical protein
VASKFKDTALADFRANGMKRNEAAEAAWEAMAKAYPPLADDTPQSSPTATAEHPTPKRPIEADDGPEIDILLERIEAGQASDLVRDTLWTYENLANHRIKASDAPSCGAWALLNWAREYRNRFFEQVLPKAMLKTPPENETNAREEEIRIEEMEKVLRKMKEGAEAETIANLQKDTSSTIRTKVHELTTDWENCFHVPLTDDARQCLKSHFGRFAQTCMNAAGGGLESSNGGSIP